MAQSKILIFMTLAILILSGVAYLYFFYEVDIQNGYRGTLNNISISAHNEYDNKLITIDYELYINSSLYSEGRTSNLGSTLDRVPVNQTYRIITFDKDNNYYNYVSPNLISNNLEIDRIDLYPRRVGELDIDHFGDLGLDPNLKLILQSNGLINEPIMCLKWSFNVLNVEAATAVVDNPRSYETYDRCYEVETLDNSNQALVLNYSLYGSLDASDFIEVMIVDRQDTINGLMSFDGSKDIGLLDQRYVITI